MPSIALYPTSNSTAFSSSNSDGKSNPLPTLLHTPSGLALLEIQGTLHASAPSPGEHATSDAAIGRLEFPLYDPHGNADEKWMKRVYLYVGKHQRLTGEVKKLPRAIAVLCKREKENGNEEVMDVDMNGVDEESTGAGDEELEVVEIVQYKILFSSRPEPVGD
jgi:chromosome transmission fidelity protein 8